ncbi:hypothetical protein BRADI_5g00865v3 [Brachypodium distachyon]|uniref:Uncharacterized protein n=1 Tax=Brachypodium distachyon TaxID=15368 RepID=A0A2K2CEP7_BRADI|nr:hypothetical protein BRADI_5g00865v3 [Brachypodium distachyon]
MGVVIRGQVGRPRLIVPCDSVLPPRGGSNAPAGLKCSRFKLRMEYQPQTPCWRSDTATILGRLTLMAEHS